MTQNISASDKEAHALLRYRQGGNALSDVTLVIGAVEYVMRVLLPRPEFSQDTREDFKQDLLCHLLTVPMTTLEANLAKRGFYAVLFYQGRSVKGELLRKAPIVTMPRRRKCGEVSRNANLSDGMHNIDDAAHAHRLEQDRVVLRLIASKADPATAKAMTLMMEEGCEPEEAAQSVGLSRPTFLRRLASLNDLPLAA